MLKISGLLFVFFLSSFLVNYRIMKTQIIKIPSYLIGFIFFILCLPLVTKPNSWEIALSLFLITYTYLELVTMPFVKSIKKKVFNTGFLMGLVLLINPHFYIFYFLLLSALIYYYKFNFRYIIIQFIGLIYPLIIYYIVSKKNPISINKDSTALLNDLTLFSHNVVFIIIIGFVLLLSFKELYENYYKKSIAAKKAFNILSGMFIFILTISILTDSAKFIHLLILPITILISNYLIYLKHKKFRTFLLGLLLMTIMLKFL